MLRSLRRLPLALMVAALALVLPLVAQKGAREGQWGSYSGENGSTGFSPANLIDRDNVKNLQIAWSWKFDNYLHVWPFMDIPQDDQHRLWGAITCPTLLMYGADSWASNPERDGRLKHFGSNASVIEFESAGHWLHHDQFRRFMDELEAFL